MKNLFLIEGDNNFLIEKEIAKIIDDNMEIVNFDLETNTLDDLVETLDTYSMFSKQKAVICKNASFLENKKDDMDFKNFFRYLENPSNNILIIKANKINHRLKTSEEILKYFKVIKIKDQNTREFILDNLEGYKMDFQTILYFINKIGNNPYVIYEELEKLKAYTLDNKTITKKDIDLVCKKNFEENIFDLIDAIIKKDKKKIEELYNYFLSNGSDVFQILIMLSNQIRLLYQVKVLSNLKNNEIASILEVKEYPVKLAREKNTFYSRAELLNLLYQLGTMDEDIKNGKQIPNISFLSYVMQM